MGPLIFVFYCTRTQFFVFLTQAGGSIDILLKAFIADAPADRNHPLALGVAVHARRCAPLRFAVGDTRSGHGYQGGRLCPGGSRRIWCQVEAGGRASAVEDGHAHEGDARSAVDDRQNKSETEVGYYDGEVKVKIFFLKTSSGVTLCA